jgi:hypothetical protein
MPRLLGRQASRALYSLSHNLPRGFTFNPLCYSQQARHIYDMPVPYSGPPSYTTLARRFSSKPNPTSFFVRERADVARENRNFDSIHDAGSADTKGISTLITDADNGILQPKISKLVSILHLKNGTDKGIYNLFMARSST